MHHRILTLHCLSPLHCGTGQGIAGIDLPIQRERHTGWPVIPGSSIKGVLRDAFRGSLSGMKADEADRDPRTIALFGPESQAKELGLGALIVSDAILLAFPVRSLVGVFAWVTCPMALGRLARLPGVLDLNNFAAFPLTDDEILADASLVADAGKVVLEDHALTQKALPPGLADALRTRWVFSAQTMLDQHLAVVSDTVFSWFARHATQVEARIALDPLTKTVNEGQLFYEETVPPESVFIAPLAAEDARHPKADAALRTATAALEAVKGLVDGKTLQFGGKATIGRGLCAMRLMGGN